MNLQFVDHRPAASSSANLLEIAPSLAGKRIAAVVFSYYPADPRVRREAEAMAAVGAEVDIYCLRGPGERPLETINGITVRRLPLERQRASRGRYMLQYANFLLQAFLRLAFTGAKAPYSLVHAHNMPDFLVFAALVPKFRGAKVILDLHDPIPELYRTKFNLDSGSFTIRLLEWVEKLSIRFADLAFTPNLAFKEIFVARGCPPEKMVIVMNSPQTEIFHPDSVQPSSASAGERTEGEFRLMFHGTLLERHGLDDLIHAVALLIREIPGIKLNIYGARTAYVSHIEGLVKTLGLESAVLYHGEQTLEQIASHILEIDLGVIPNKRTPFTEINMPTRIFEYLALQKPVIAPRTRGIGDYFQEHQILYFEPGDVHNLAARIRWAHDHPEELRAVTREGRTVFQAFDWEAQKLALLSAVESLLTPVPSPTLKIAGA